jgi:ABC-type phosphate transport system ATPase subunit
MLFQRPYMLRTSVLNNVALGLWLGGVRWPDAKPTRWPRWSASGWKAWPRAMPRLCQAASSSAWRWRGPGH